MGVEEVGGLLSLAGASISKATTGGKEILRKESSQGPYGLMGKGSRAHAK